MYRPPTEDTGNPETQTATDQKKKKTKKTLLQKKSGLGPGKRNLARQKTFRHKLLNPSQSMVLVKNTDSELHPRLLESATWGWSSALCFDRSSKWCWCLLKFQNHWYGLFFGWRNLRREAGWFAPGDSLYSLVLVLDLPRMPLLVLKSYENRGNFRHIWIVLTSIVVQLLSHVQLFVTPWTAACQASLSFTISLSFHKLLGPLSQWCHPTI